MSQQPVPPPSDDEPNAREGGAFDGRAAVVDELRGRLDRSVAALLRSLRGEGDGDGTDVEQLVRELRSEALVLADVDAAAARRSLAGLTADPAMLGAPVAVEALVQRLRGLLHEPAEAVELARADALSDDGARVGAAIEALGEIDHPGAPLALAAVVANPDHLAPLRRRAGALLAQHRRLQPHKLQSLIGALDPDRDLVLQLELLEASRRLPIVASSAARLIAAKTAAEPIAGDAAATCRRIELVAHIGGAAAAMELTELARLVGKRTERTEIDAFHSAVRAIAKSPRESAGGLLRSLHGDAKDGFGTPQRLALVEALADLGEPWCADYVEDLLEGLLPAVARSAAGDRAAFGNLGPLRDAVAIGDSAPVADRVAGLEVIERVLDRLRPEGLAERDEALASAARARVAAGLQAEVGEVVTAAMGVAIRAFPDDAELAEVLHAAGARWLERLADQPRTPREVAYGLVPDDATVAAAVLAVPDGTPVLADALCGATSRPFIDAALWALAERGEGIELIDRWFEGGVRETSSKLLASLVKVRDRAQLRRMLSAIDPSGPSVGTLRGPLGPVRGQRRRDVGGAPLDEGRADGKGHGDDRHSAHGAHGDRSARGTRWRSHPQGHQHPGRRPGHGRGHGHGLH